MCEPTHSVSQWATPEVLAPSIERAVEAIDFYHPILPPGDVSGVADDVGQWQDGATSLLRIQMEFGPAARFLSTDAGFFHLSRFGQGHHESRSARLGRSNWMSLQATSYEIKWWERKVQFDGPLVIPQDVENSLGMPRPVLDKMRELIRGEALIACTLYAKKTSIGDLKIFRRFLEETIRATPSLPSYQEVLFDLFKGAGRDELTRRLQQAELDTIWSSGVKIDRPQRDRLAKVVCGLTRDRTLIRDEWADDNAIWTG
jgi:hypothetical protein